MRKPAAGPVGVTGHVEVVGVPCRRLLKSSHKPIVSSNKKIGPP